MSVADEIRTLKELLDRGALTPTEFEEAKRRLLQTLSKPQEGMPEKTYFLGTWRIGNDTPATDITLSTDGTFNIKVDLAKEAAQARVYWTMVELMKLMQLAGGGGSMESCFVCKGRAEIRRASIYCKSGQMPPNSTLISWLGSISP